MRCGYGKPLQEALPALPLLLQRAMQSTRYVIPERSQQIATRICADARQRGNEEDQHAVRLFGFHGIQHVLDNLYGFRPRGTILDGHLDHTVQTRNLNDCIWNVMEATLKAK